MVAITMACACLGTVRSAFALDPFVRPDIDTTLLPGTYHRVVGTLRQTITFHKDGTFSGKAWTARSALDDEYSGDWYLQGGYGQQTTLTYVVRKSRKIPKDTEDADYIVVLNQKCLSIVPADGGECLVAGGGEVSGGAARSRLPRCGALCL